MQTEALFPTSGEKRPGAQDLHSEAQPGDGLCRPGWHAQHAASMELLMMLRLSSLLDPAPTAVRPAGQSRHTLLEFAPCCVANLPAGQSWHASSERSGPESSENFPAGQSRHASFDNTLELPARAAQREAGAVHDAASDVGYVENLPAGHTTGSGHGSQLV